MENNQGERRANVQIGIMETPDKTSGKSVKALRVTLDLGPLPELKTPDDGHEVVLEFAMDGLRNN